MIDAILSSPSPATLRAALVDLAELAIRARTPQLPLGHVQAALGDRYTTHTLRLALATWHRIGRGAA